MLGSKLQISHKTFIRTSKQVVIHTNNSASYGGAIYVVDNTTTGTCASSKLRTVTTSLQSECFFQFLTLMPILGVSSYPLIEDYFRFTQNFANVSGGNLYGGLLDRCTVYSSGRHNTVLQCYKSHADQCCIRASPTVFLCSRVQFHCAQLCA